MRPRLLLGVIFSSNIVPLSAHIIQSSQSDPSHPLREASQTRKVEKSSNPFISELQESRPRPASNCLQVLSYRSFLSLCQNFRYSNDTQKYLKQKFAFCFLRIIACRSFLTEVFSLSQNYGYNDREEILDTDICYLHPAYHCLQKVSFFAKTSDTIEKQKKIEKYICFLRIIACRSFHIDVFSLCQKLGYNEKEEILETDICYLLHAYYCLQKFSFSVKTSDTIKKQKYSKKIFAICFLRIIACSSFLTKLSGFNCGFYHLHLFFLFADELHVFFLVDFVPLSLSAVF